MGEAAEMASAKTCTTAETTTRVTTTASLSPEWDREQ
jgi:hypothetical protein